MLDPPTTSSNSGPIHIDGPQYDAVLSELDVVTRSQLFSRRARRVKQLARIYRDHYWALMEDLKCKYRNYYWLYGKSPFEDDDEENIDNNSRNFGGKNRIIKSCKMRNCRAKAMALTEYCRLHILRDDNQKLYKACNFSISSSSNGPIPCGKPTLRSTVPSYCTVHFQKAEKIMAHALDKAGLNVSSTSKLAPKFHIIVSEYVHQIQSKRRAAQMLKLENAEFK